MTEIKHKAGDVLVFMANSPPRTEYRLESYDSVHVRVSYVEDGTRITYDMDIDIFHNLCPVSASYLAEL
ncbi:MAG: hypothetical protein ACREHG_05820 [Candidatus Saccharimonadales bacterium]